MDGLQLPISLKDYKESYCADLNVSVPQELRDTFRNDGFVVVPDVLDAASVDALNDRLEEVLRGRYDRGQAPDKTPRLIRVERRPKGDQHVKEDAHPAPVRINNKPSNGIGPLGFSGNLDNVRVLQVINVHKSDQLFRALATHPLLGKVVANLAGWPHGARLAQDQCWAKPPNAPPLVFHRDSPYFMFDPPDVVTVWIALDDMEEEIGPLEYVRGSHKWGDGRVGSSNQFFEADGGHSLLRSAADRAGVDELDIVSMAGLKAGGLSIHDGRTWHGSGKNESRTRPRRGLGLHFVPAEVRFTKEAGKSSLWHSYVDGVDDPSKVELSAADFPITWEPSKG